MRPSSLTTGIAVLGILLNSHWGMANDWLHFGADSVYSGNNTEERRLGPGTVGDLEQRWGIGCNDSWFSVISGSPAIRNGVLYTSGAGSRLTAYEARTGRMLWEFGQGNMGWAPQPVVSNGGTVFYLEGSYPTEMYAVNGMSGEQLWHAPLAFDLGYSDTAIVTVDEANNRVYVVETPSNTEDGKVFALDGTTGDIVWWKGPATDNLGFKGDHVLLHEGSIYVVAITEDEHQWPVEMVVAVDTLDQNIKATFSRPSDIELREISRISICGETLIVNFCDRDDVFESEGILVAFDLGTGVERWRMEANGPITGSIACNETLGKIYVPAGPYLRALRITDGSEIWNYLGFDDIFNPSLANGIVYFISDTNAYALDENTGGQLFRFALGHDGYNTTQIAIADAMLFFSGNGGTCDLYALALQGENPGEAIDGFIPAAAKNAGAAGTVWGTTVWAFQDDVDTATLVLRAGNTGRPADEVEAHSVSVARGQVVRIDDVLSLFPEVSPPAALFYSWLGVEPDQGVITSRTFTAAPGSAPGTLGQGIVGINLLDLPQAGTSHVVPLSPDTDLVRSNLGIVNADTSEAAFVVRIHSEDGSVVAQREYTLPAGSWRQINGVFASFGMAPVDRAFAEVVSTPAGGQQSGTPLFAIYASLVDNSSGDPTYLAGQWEGAFGETVIPVAAHNPGANNTQWVTDVSTLNWQGDDGDLSSYTFLAEGVANYPSAAGSRTFPIDSNHHLYLGDVLLNLYGETNRKGAIISSGTPDNRWSRTYNAGSSGTYGQSLPGLKVSENAIEGSTRGVMIGLEESMDFRSNIEMVNTSTETTNVSIVYMTAEGVPLGTRQYQLPPRGMEQISTPFAAFGGVHDGRAQVSSDHAVIVYASVVDNATGDASTVLSKRLQ